MGIGRTKAIRRANSQSGAYNKLPLKKRNPRSLQREENAFCTEEEEQGNAGRNHTPWPLKIKIPN